ncbi:NAD(P)-binding protein [Sarocladium strictum]
MARQWTLAGQEGFEKSLQLNENAHFPSAEQLKLDQVLVRIHAASLNYRDVDVASPTSMVGAIKTPLAPACDGAGVVEAVGQSVKDFKAGDRVVTIIGPVPNDDFEYCMADAGSMLGIGNDGTLLSKVVFTESTLVRAPKSLDWLQASILTVTWITAWDALFGIEGHYAGPGKTVLVQGTGGDSVATLQLAVAAGAAVIATTSSSERAAKLKALGARAVINYRENANWGQEARAMTPGGQGCDIVVDVGGNETLRRSLAAVKTNGIVLIIGAEMNEYIDEKGLKPAFNEVVFEFLSEKKHFAKVVVRVD